MAAMATIAAWAWTIRARRTHRHDLRRRQQHCGAGPGWTRIYLATEVMAFFSEVANFANRRGRGDEHYTAPLSTALGHLQQATTLADAECYDETRQCRRRRATDYDNFRAPVHVRRRVGQSSAGQDCSRCCDALCEHQAGDRAVERMLPGDFSSSRAHQPDAPPPWSWRREAFCECMLHAPTFFTSS